MEHDLEKLAVTALPISASPIMRHDFCIESWKHCEQVKSELLNHKCLEVSWDSICY